jgi:AAA family ATP:ADP antiporter
MAERAAMNRSPLERVLGLAAEVRPGEGTTAVMLSFAGFLTLASYYTIRPLRSAFLLPVDVTLPGGLVLTGPVVTSYSGAVLAALFLFIVPAYGALASRVNRVRLINVVTLFFASNLVIFSLVGRSLPPAALGILFFLWVGTFNLMVQAQFWSFANDVYTEEQGKRLFAIVGFGATLGGVAGARIAASLIRTIGEFQLMLVAAVLLAVFMAILNIVHAREGARAPEAGKQAAAALGKEGGFQLVLRHRYLLLIGLLTLTVQVTNTNGNYILDETLATAARAAMAAGTAAGLSEGQFIGSFRADMDFYQNVLVALIQFFLVSRIFKYLGIGGALFILPTLAFINYGMFAAAPILAIIRVAKITENATDYSLQNTLRRALFLPTSREAKYKALQAVETFFWRAGDMFSALTTFVVIQVLQLGVRSYAMVNLGLVVVWFFIAANLFRENRRLTTENKAAAA